MVYKTTTGAIQEELYKRTIVVIQNDSSRYSWGAVQKSKLNFVRVHAGAIQKDPRELLEPFKNTSENQAMYISSISLEWH